MLRSIVCVSSVTLLLCSCVSSSRTLAQDIDFNKDIRPILSNKCFACHGPDEGHLEAGLRLDDGHIATAPLESGVTAIVPGDADRSELMARITHDDADLRMPPASFGKRLTDREIATIRKWIQQGAPYARHWAYVNPEQPVVPQPADGYQHWVKNPIDNFVVQKMLEHGLKPSAEADREAIARRVFLDVIGLPPTSDEVAAFVADTSPNAYENLVDGLLQRSEFGEHWARKWLDLARYADSAGYADDPARTIWAYRDWVVRAINKNMPFDQFTIEQLAGDLLPDATDEQLIATAFHRNTLTNNEGGTNDEEFRNVAVVDRVNTTLAVWMGTTMACAQCHSHKYDPISQEDYFKVFAILNNTQDADRRDESPVLEFFTDEQREQKKTLQQQIVGLQTVLNTPTDELAASQLAWEQSLLAPSQWHKLSAASVTRSSGQPATVQDDGLIKVTTAAETDVYTLDVTAEAIGKSADGKISIAGLKIETSPDETFPGGGAGLGGGNFVITQIRAQVVPPGDAAPVAQFVRISIPGKKKILSLAEVQVFSSGTNVAVKGKATQSTTDFGGPAEYAIDGNTDGQYENKSVTHTSISDDPWWEVDLGSVQAIEKLTLWNRAGDGLAERLSNFNITLLDGDRNPVWQQNVAEPPKLSASYQPSGILDISLQSATSDYSQDGFPAASVISNNPNESTGWAVGGAIKERHSLVLVPKQPIDLDAEQTLRLILEQKSKHKDHLLASFSLHQTADQAAIQRSNVPALLLAIIETPVDQRTIQQKEDLAGYYRQTVAPSLADIRKQLADSEKRLSEMKPATSVPVLRELTSNRRSTHLQYRGSYLDKGPEVSEGVPAALHPMKPEFLDGQDGRPTRLSLAKWLVDNDNPLTSRVLVNRYWETIFGRGIVMTSEEFGSQGEPPTHPDLLDWLAVEVRQNGWDTKALLKLLVTSATYRQSSYVSPASYAVDSDNRWLARGPRVRLSAETIRDQALFVSGLLSQKLYGPPVKPPQPSLGLNAAFGSSTDWQTSMGEDRYRRALYTTWRRSNPYPSMATFDAPNREVCTVRRNRTNTPLQSLVTLNDPVYVEAAQSLARIALQQPGERSDQVSYAFRRCLLRSPADHELQALLNLYDDAHQQLAEHPEEAKRLATEPLGDLPSTTNAVDAAAMTVVGNVLLNLDEMFLKR